jgi:capsular exopolysaccharide synthesis family protein
MQEPTVVDSEPESPSASHIVHVLLQFAMAVRYRKNVVVAALLVSGLLGALYYATATRYYSAKASLLVMQPGNDMLDQSAMSSAASRQSLMPTYESLITSVKVLEGALPHIPPEDCIDLAHLKRQQWPKALRANLSAQTVRFTNIIEIEYLSKDPKAAVSVVKAIVESYLDFMDRTHKGTANEVIDVLTRQKTQVAEQLAAKEDELQAARQQAGDLGAGTDDKARHPLMQQWTSFNEALVETQKQRVAMEATLHSIETSLRNGDGLEQHIMTVADIVGREFLLESLGINQQNAAVQSTLEREMLADQAKLQAMEKHLGPQHPEVLALQERIRQTQQYLIEYPQRGQQRLAEIKETRLGPMLRDMMRQKLDETWQKELSLKAEADRAQAAARGLSDQLARIDRLDHEVTRLRDWDDLLRDQLAKVDGKQDGPGILVAPLNEPTIASSPVSPSATRVVLLAIMAGLAMGLLGVYVLDTLDDRFRSLEEMQRQLRAPVLSMVRRLELKDCAGLDALQVYSHPDAAESEAFRTLRTALSLASEASARIVISSAEPGDGKTTILANLAVAYAQSGKRTLIIDADLRRPGLTTMLALREADGLSTVIRGRDDVVGTAMAHVRASGVEGLDVLPSGPRPTNPAELLASGRFSELLAWAESVYDHILIDSPPALATSDAAVIGRLVDGVILVVQPEKNRRRLVLRAVESFLTLKINLLGVVINRVATHRDGDYYGYGYGGYYGYHYGYDEDDKSDKLGDQRQCPAEPRNRLRDGESSASEGIVPRRVA